MVESGLEGKDGFALLGRRSEGSLEVLALRAPEGEVLCLFETRELADAFSRVNPEVRGQGWLVHVMTLEGLPDLAERFDYVTIDPSPGGEKELVPALGFARALRRQRRDDPGAG